MEDLLKKISRYNFANFLIPGSLYVLLMAEWLSLADITTNPLYFMIAAYFAGAVISRVGSTVVRPVLFRIQRLRFDQYTYQDYVAADQSDERIAALLEDRNLYRSIIALILVSYLSLRYLDFRAKHPWVIHYELEGFALILLLLFIIAYVRQDSFITKRVLTHKTKQEEDAD